jgi:hypothetical protein
MRQNDPVELRHEHLMNLVLEYVIIPRHPIGHHDEGCPFLEEISRHEVCKPNVPGP